MRILCRVFFCLRRLLLCALFSAVGAVDAASVAVAAASVAFAFSAFATPVMPSTNYIPPPQRELPRSPPIITLRHRDNYHTIWHTSMIIKRRVCSIFLGEKLTCFLLVRR